jgi:diadenosine tetraphosphatase ApaH/serine/threonine PP2A family protein phosphatase
MYQCFTDIILAVLTSRIAGDKEFSFLSFQQKISCMIDECRSILSDEPSVLCLSGDFAVVGDIHGNVDDLIRIFERIGYPPDAKYLFLGDYVDRGTENVEVLLFLFTIKVLFPDHVYLIRGNHECPSVCSFYGFKDECDAKLTDALYAKFIDCFTFLPFAARLNSHILCVHGGIGPEFATVHEIASLRRPLFSFDSPVANAVVWSDPNIRLIGFDANDRGTGSYFGPPALDRFMTVNDLSLLIRSHEVCPQGYEWSFGSEGKCLTVFSNTNYCGTWNRGAVALVGADKAVTFEMLAPLSQRELRRKLVLIPEWIFRAPAMAPMIPVDSPDDTDMLNIESDLALTLT